MSGGWGRDIATLYFGYRPVGAHDPECPRSGTSIWEATRFTYERFHGCPGCGAVTFTSFDDAASEEYTHAAEIGYGARPEKVGVTGRGQVSHGSGQEFGSRRAVVTWIAAQAPGGGQ